MALDKFRRASRAKLNFTERYSLPPSNIVISVDPALTPLQLRVNQLVLPDALANDAQILVEAYRSSTGHYERVSFGDAGAFKSGAGLGAGRPLRRIQNAEGLRFRVKIVEGAQGRLIAEADGLRAIEESDERAVDDLFPVIPKTLNGELWKVAFSGDGPEIWVEKSLNHAGVFLWTLPAFQALTLPMALRQVAERIIRNRDAEEPWYERWTVFLTNFAPSLGEALEADEDPDNELMDGILDEIASNFARKFELLSIGTSALREGVDE
jgi:hypothetical protein